METFSSLCRSTGGMALKDSGVAPTRSLCSSGDTNEGTDEMMVVETIVLDAMRDCACDCGQGHVWFSPTMAVPSDAQAKALLAHVASQMQLNVAFLESQNYLSAQDAATMKGIIQRLPAGTTTVAKVAPAVARTAQDEKQVLADPPKVAPVYARALWAYNENSAVCMSRFLRHNSDCRQDPNDLAFSAGDMIEIVAETNEDWWLGRAHGREGLLPSNHVEKVQDVSLQGPPPPAAGGVNSIGLQQNPENKNKFGKYGNTVIADSTVLLLANTHADGPFRCWGPWVWCWYASPSMSNRTYMLPQGLRLAVGWCGRYSRHRLYSLGYVCGSR